ncbi:MAG: hypothetical protein AUJ24_00290 [Parcubacteria group bacterium CG1_02_36_42]|uniref:Endolytic murein transglycosylase n=1 Tax=Candidatus Nealsonbacteria bacterium CG_4_9_14_0_8_um_filter_35_12 TaxID=1974692 RepID=A0A2M8DNA8_9BACT|nr:MAG: hypothetical protein AUJ24_00290 [Parcubacteria group bacterium CG1_02_36_42]PJB99603.1 MAG: endolytic transglycosylase MltG [Candidatus Nealsonbacteria bacterium CG_4_9_14_0_8_um_filter_35_12]
MEKNSNITKKSWVIVSLCFLFFVFCFLIFVWQGIYLPKNPMGKEKIFAIGKGEGVREISFNLEKEGLIKSRLFFRIYVLSKGVSRNLQAGNYSLSPSMAIPEIAQKIVSGDVIKEKITVIEGWNKKEIANYLEERGIIQSKDFLEKTKYIYWKEKYYFLKDRPDLNSYDRGNHGQEERDIEGYLFPDTYYIRKQETDNKEQSEEIIRNMLDNFDKKLTPDLREEINLQGKTIFEIITMASMLEKEVKDFEAKKLVSGILWKRFKNGIPLQVDATITYITGKKTTQISLEDLQIDSPYNAYKYRGLPLGPICNPGLESILAAIYPKESEYWYYLSTPEETTIFSKTLQEHNLAKVKYLR